MPLSYHVVVRNVLESINLKDFTRSQDDLFKEVGDDLLESSG